MKHVFFWLLIMSCGFATAEQETAGNVAGHAIAAPDTAKPSAGPYTLFVVYPTAAQERASYPPMQVVYFGSFEGCNTARKATKLALKQANQGSAQVWCTPG